MHTLLLDIQKRIQKLPKTLVAMFFISALILIIGFIVIYLTVGKKLGALVENPVAFKSYLESFGVSAKIIFVLIRAFQTVVKVIPAEPLEIASGYAFGAFGGLLYCSLGTLIGSLFIVLFTRIFRISFVEKFVNPEELNKIKLPEDKNGRRLFLLVFYLIPGTPKDILTYAAGLSKINMLEFFLITSAARIPSIITSTVCGNELGKNNVLNAVIVLAATGAVSIIAGIVYKKRKEQ